MPIYDVCSLNVIIDGIPVVYVTRVELQRSPVISYHQTIRDNEPVRV